MNYYHDIIELLQRPELEFSNSIERERLRGNADDLPGVMLAAYGGFISRKIRDNSAKEELLLLFEPLNEIAECDIDLAYSALTDELFERFEVDGVLEVVPKYMGDRLKQLLSDWIAV